MEGRQKRGLGREKIQPQQVANQVVGGGIQATLAESFKRKLKHHVKRESR